MHANFALKKTNKIMPKSSKTKKYERVLRKSFLKGNMAQMIGLVWVIGLHPMFYIFE